MTCAGSVWGGPWRGGLAGWPSGSPGSCAAQRGALCRHDWPTAAQKQKSPPPASTGGGPGRKGWQMLLVDSVSALPLVVLEGLHGVTGLLHRAGHEATHCPSFPRHLGGYLIQGGTVLALKHADYFGHFGACAWPGGLLRLGGLLWRRRCLGFGRVLGGGHLLACLALGRRALGRLCATSGLFPGLRLRGRCLGLLRFRFGLRRFAEALDAEKPETTP